MMVSTIPQQMFEVSRNDFRPSREILNRKIDDHTAVDVQNRSRFYPSSSPGPRLPQWDQCLPGHASWDIICPH